MVVRRSCWVASYDCCCASARSLVSSLVRNGDLRIVLLSPRWLVGRGITCLPSIMPPWKEVESTSCMLWWSSEMKVSRSVYRPRDLLSLVLNWSLSTIRPVILAARNRFGKYGASNCPAAQLHRGCRMYLTNRGGLSAPLWERRRTRGEEALGVAGLISQTRVLGPDVRARAVC